MRAPIPKSLSPAAGDPETVRCVSPAMEAVYEQIRRIADGDFPVLVVGETGAGKEHAVRRIHRSSSRAGGPFVAVNCASIPADLLEAEMFGVERGAATGVEARPGKFRFADGGVLFLDEIGEMSPALQAKLLRVLDDGRIDPLGGRPVDVDVRIVAATNRDLPGRVEAGRFRADLYYRIAGYLLEVPPLRERPEDLPLLVQHFFARACRQAGREVTDLNPEVVRHLASRPWPGNIRQLEHEVRGMVYRCPPGEVMDVACLSPPANGSESVASPARGAAETRLGAGGLAARLEELERELIRQALEEAGSQRGAARLLRVSRNGLAMKMRRLGISPPR